MKCRQGHKARVIATRKPKGDINYKQRRYECPECKERFFTIERMRDSLMNKDQK